MSLWYLSLLLAAQPPLDMAGAEPNPSWCAREPIGGDAHQIVAKIAVPSEQDSRRLMNRVLDSSVSEMSSDEGAQLVGDSGQSRYYYVVRAVVFGPFQISGNPVSSYAGSMYYELWSDDSGDAVLLASKAQAAEGARAHNFPLVVGTDRPIRNVAVACYYVP